MGEKQLADALRRIDSANAEDPEHPRALDYGQRMSVWVEKLSAAPSEVLQLAARAQHIRRWDIPRSTFPEGRDGYKKWRKTLYVHHADQTEQIMREVGYGDEEVERVRDLLMKRRLKIDPECQCLEDAACLVFLQTQIDEFATKHDREKLITILQKTWKKMSERGHEAALQLELSPEVQDLVKEALGA